ncbi:hypothetical protein [Bacillus sp. FJAT-42315]|uniref:hypothetical protein n=1 Tax=Bacillus sp. FJAT-42315 TaxID=2014077 RepID=UPI000C230D3B|nr:hypothetical protein [Bacillus sp. FJAT-42315]
MEENIKWWIERYQQEGDEEALEQLKVTCWPMIEPLIEELTKKHGAEVGELLREKGLERFAFIFSKYQLNVQLPLETFVANTYRFYFMQVLKEQA